MSSEPGKSDKKPAKPQPTLGLEFITSVGSIDRDDATRRKVRSHAKRSALKSSRETRGTDVPGEGPLGVAAEVAFSSTSSSLPVRPAPIQQSREAGTSKFKLVDPAASGSSSKVAKRKDKDEKSLVRRRRDAAPSEEAIVGGSSLDAAAGQSSEHGDRRGKGSERIFPDGRYPMDADFDGPHPGLLPADMNPATAELLKFCKWIPNTSSRRSHLPVP